MGWQRVRHDLAAEQQQVGAVLFLPSNINTFLISFILFFDGPVQYQTEIVRRSILTLFLSLMCEHCPRLFT